jgi:prepilin-type N-terminal cleavage/methylation domain-containing protein
MAKGGFTLIELLVVIGIITVLAGLVSFVDLNNYRGDAFRAEVAALGSALQTARADALNNIDQNKHGVAIHPGGYNGYVLYEGDSYALRIPALDQKVSASYGVTLSPSSPTEVVFDQLSGDASYDGDITFVDPNRSITAAITINHEGRISW